MSALKGKIAVVTGSSSGIGLVTAKRFVKEGAYVFITGRRQAELDKAVAEIGSNLTAVQRDVSNLNDLDPLYKEVAAKKSKLDVLFANAGIDLLEAAFFAGDTQLLAQLLFLRLHQHRRNFCVRSALARCQRLSLHVHRDLRRAMTQ